MKKITVIGAGMMASALCVPMRDNGCEVKLIGTPLDDAIIDGLKADGRHITLDRRLPDGIDFYRFSELDDGFFDCDIVVSGVSSFGVEWFAEAIIPYLKPGIPVLGVTKGLYETGRGLISFPEYYETKRSDVPFCAVGGPCTSYELADRANSSVAFCGRDKAVLDLCASALETPYYHVERSTDVRGIETAVALKNCYALGVTLAVGEYEVKAPGRMYYNPQAAMFTESVREMRRLVARIGGAAESLDFGIGDLYVTIYGGRTRKLGILLGSGKTFAEARAILNGVTLESVEIARRIGAYVEARGEIDDFPLLKRIYGMIKQ